MWVRSGAVIGGVDMAAAREVERRADCRQQFDATPAGFSVTPVVTAVNPCRCCGPTCSAHWAHEPAAHARSAPFRAWPRLRRCRGAAARTRALVGHGRHAGGDGYGVDRGLLERLARAGGR